MSRIYSMIKMFLLTRRKSVFNQKTPGFFLSLNKKGQAVLEYILLLIIALSIILGALYQLNDAFRKFTSSLFGDYLACLLESGELPGQSGLCQASFKPFKLTDGNTLVPSGSSSGSSSSGPSSNNPGSTSSGPGGSNGSDYSTSNDGSSRSGRDGGAYGGSRDSSSAGGGRGDGGGSAAGSRSGSGQSEKSGGSIPAGAGDGANGASGSGGRFKPSRGQSGSSAESGESAEATGGDGEKSDRSRSGGYGNLNSSATSTKTSSYDEYLGRLRYVPSRSEKQEEKEPASKKIEVTEADKKPKGARLPTSSSDQSKKEQNMELDSSITFPNFIRYLLIAAIAIAIVLFLGGQALAIKKGQEK